jgi:succinate-acetate transporter protein
MMIWSTRTTIAVFLVFVVLEATEVILFIGAFAGAATVLRIGGYVGVADAVIAWYTSAATVGNSMARRIVAPVGGPLWRDPVAATA